MDRQFWKEFFAKLETADDDDLLDMRRYLRALRNELEGSEIMSDIKRALRLTEEEIVTRKMIPLEEEAA